MKITVTRAESAGIIEASLTLGQINNPVLGTSMIFKMLIHYVERFLENRPNGSADHGIGMTYDEGGLGIMQAYKIIVVIM